MARRIRTFRRLCLSAAATTGAGLLTACASTVVVESEFPAPLVESLPVHIGVILDPSLQDYVHVEDLPEQSSWTIDLGDANVAMLQPLLTAMFDQVDVVDGVPLGPEQAGQFDGVLRPALEKFEFDVPFGQRDEFVEVWMQYRLTLYDANGDVVIDWPVSGYGKAELIGSQEKVVNRAAVVAMREVGANISTKFSQLAEVSYWLTERANAAALSVQNQVVN